MPKGAVSKFRSRTEHLRPLRSATACHRRTTTRRTHPAAFKFFPRLVTVCLSSQLGQVNVELRFVILLERRKVAVLVTVRHLSFAIKNRLRSLCLLLLIPRSRLQSMFS